MPSIYADGEFQPCKQNAVALRRVMICDTRGIAVQRDVAWLEEEFLLLKPLFGCSHRL
jgi:hypothetical protein